MSDLAPEFDKLSIITDDGSEFTSIESATVSSTFLTPCDNFELEIGGEFALPDVAKKFALGKVVRIAVNDRVQMTGYVDATRLSYREHGGSKLLVRGRDFLSPIVDGNVDPRIKVAPSMTISDLVSLVILKEFGFTTYEIRDTPQAGDVAIGSGIKRGKYESRHKRRNPIKELRPHDQEGAFAYLARILTHYGYWMWADADDFGVVISGPDYDQSPSFELTCKYDPQATGAGRVNNIVSADATTDQTNIPSHVFLRGVDSGAGTKTAVKAMAVNPLVSLFKPAYVVDRDSHTKEMAETRARFFSAKQMRHFFQYECEVRGFSDPATGNVYNANTVGTVKDEITGTDGPLWVFGRRFRKSRDGGTRTSLTMIPLGTLLLDWQDDSPPAVAPDYRAVSSNVGAQSPLKTDAFAVNGTQFYNSEAAA